ncbi:MAG: DUF2148 domain-containing protein [Anaerovorax sp.]|nr:DUF2148 domain-containing protein [Anaerovorax sp.]
MICNGKDVEKNAVMQVAELMAAAARTAPKGCGIDNLEVLILDGEEKDNLAKAMREYGAEWQMDFMVRDGYNVEACDALLLMGAKIHPILLDHCGYCGYKNCGENMKNNGICSFNTGDLGIAIGSAVSVAANHRIDNRVIYTAGKIAMEIGLFPNDVRVAYGIPLSVSSKSPFFDRGTTDNEAVKREKR